jgi:hypothetical protein
MTLAEKLHAFINDGITNKKTVYISTRLQITKVTPKTFQAWEKIGKSLFFIDKEGCLRIRSGKNSDIICSPTINHVKVTIE